MTPEQEVDVITRAEAERLVERSLHRLNLTLDELRRQAQSGRFQSEGAHKTWLAIKALNGAAA